MLKVLKAGYMMKAAYEEVELDEGKAKYTRKLMKNKSIVDYVKKQQEKNRKDVAKFGNKKVGAFGNEPRFDSGSGWLAMASDEVKQNRMSDDKRRAFDANAEYEAIARKLGLHKFEPKLEEVDLDEGKLPDMRDALMQVRAEKPVQLDEEVELDEGGMKRQLMKVSDLITTLINQGGMDKSDYEAARGYVEDGDMKGLAYMVKKLDTEPRDMIINAVAKGLGKKQAEQIFKVSIRRVEEVEIDEAQYGDKKALAKKGAEITRVQSILKGKEKPYKKTPRKKEEVEIDEKKGSAGASLKDVMALDKKHAAHKKQSKKDQKRRDANRASNRAAGMEEVEIDEAKPEFEVKYAKSKRGPIKVTKFMTLDQAKEFLADVKKDGMNGIISKGGKPVKEETILERIDRKLKERKNG